jgi:hypothetical protein
MEYVSAAGTQAVGAQKVRPDAVAGSFYPSNPKALSTMLDEFLSQASASLAAKPILVPLHDRILAAVAPHAGYPYSGPVAATAYAALQGRNYARVVVVAPSHFDSFDFTSVYDGDAYQTPLGAVPVDKAFARQLIEMDPALRLSGHGHDPTPAGAEHSIEVELPWLQKVLGDFEVVPIAMGSQSYEASRALGVALAKLAKAEALGGETLVLASSDLSHYHSRNEAKRIDGQALSALEAWDYFSMSRNFQLQIWEACGGAPMVAAMIYAERMGANQARVLKYANSGDITGEDSNVVGYGAAIFVKSFTEKEADKPFSLSEQEKSEMLALARNSVEHVVREGEAYEPPVYESEALNQQRGAFVTLREKNGALRGCVGYTSAIKPLYITVRDTAILATMHDSRFTPVSVAELPNLTYEISVLSPLRRVTDVEQIRIGEHGLLIKNGGREGLLLPQVPVEQDWDRRTFLEQTCVKARLPQGCWKDEDTDIFSFTAVVFSEDGAVDAVDFAE